MKGVVHQLLINQAPSFQWRLSVFMALVATHCVIARRFALMALLFSEASFWAVASHNFEAAWKTVALWIVCFVGFCRLLLAVWLAQGLAVYGQSSFGESVLFVVGHKVGDVFVCLTQSDDIFLTCLRRGAKVFWSFCVDVVKLAILLLWCFWILVRVDSTRCARYA